MAESIAPILAMDMESPSAKCSVFIATSLDGYIAREDGGIDWLEAQNGKIPPGEDCGYGEFVSAVDCIVMGRQTFEQVLTFDPWPFADKPVVVLSRSLTALPGGLPETVSLAAATPAQLVHGLARQGFRHLYVDGGRTIQSFLAAGLIDAMTITTVPVLLGGGRPLFGPLAREVEVELLAVRKFDFGFVQRHYRVCR